MPPARDILFERVGRIGIITLNRPRALNALTWGMTRRLRTRLRAWAAEPSVRAVVIRGAGARAFCAGGDISAIYENRHLDRTPLRRFYRDEYRLNVEIKRFPKPYIALLDGIVMGGGAGVAMHGSHRIVTEDVMFAMPETGIGLFPDVGATYVLPRCPGEIGMYLGLTGARLGAADTIYVGVATGFVAAEQLGGFVEGLGRERLTGDPFAAVDTILARHAGSAGAPPLAARRCDIDRHFAMPSAGDIMESLAAADSEWVAETLSSLRGKSPTSLAVSFRQLCEGRTLDFTACMRLEYRLVTRFIESHDFYEGIRAALIDKDRSPKWNPGTLAAVSAADVDRYFASLGRREMRL
jgi:enoyl-CoA hydratase